MYMIFYGNSFDKIKLIIIQVEYIADYLHIFTIV